MSSFLSNKFLEYRNPKVPKTIDQDLCCAGCGYNLRGLTYGRNCPECGQQIVRTGSADPLIAGDWSQRQRTLLGLTCLSLCLYYAAAARLGLFVCLVFLGIGPAAKIYVYAGLAASVAWIVGVWIMTSRRLHNPGGGVTALLWIARLLSLLFLAGYLIWISTLSAGSPFFAGPMNQSAASNVVLRCGGGVGVLVMAFILLRMSANADLEDATKRIHLSIWLLPFSTLMMSVMPTTVPWVFLLVIIFFLLAWCWTVVLLGRGVWVMAQHVRWSMRLTEHNASRLTRLAESRGEIDAEIAARVRPTPAAEPEIPLVDRRPHEYH